MLLNKNTSRLGGSELLENVELLFNNVSKIVNKVELSKTSFFIELPPPLPLALPPSTNLRCGTTIGRLQDTDTFCMILLQEHDDGDTHSVDATWNHRNERDGRRIKLLKQKWCGRPCAIFWRALKLCH